MKLTSILTTGTWADATNRLNQNFKKLETDVNTLTLATRKNKGFFKTLADLKTAIPNGSLGDIAYVSVNGDMTSPFYVYAWTNGSWVSMEKTQSFDNVDFSGYYTIDETEALFLKQDVFYNHIGEFNQAIDEINAQITFLNEREDASEEWIAEAKERLANLELQVNALAELFSGINETFERIEETIETNSNEINRLNTEIENEVIRATTREDELSEALDYVETTALTNANALGINQKYFEVNLDSNYKKGDIVIYSNNLYQFKEDYNGNSNVFDSVVEPYHVVEKLEETKSAIPVFEESTEEAIEEMISNGTWKEGVIYYTVEE